MSDLPRILIVDADDDHRQLLVRGLGSLGIVEAAADGQEGWARVEASQPHVLIADQRLPGLPGVELLSRAAARDPHVGRILLTNFGDTQITIDAIDSRIVDAYLAKPCLPHQLRLSIESVLERSRLARENARLCEDLVARNEQLRQALESLRKAQRRVLDSERLSAIGRMIAMIVHDFRGPLTVVRTGAGSLAREASEPGEVVQIAAEIGAEADRMAGMCRDLLDVTRVSGGPIAQTEEELDELVEGALALVTEHASHSGVRVESSLRSGARLLVDRDRLRRVVLNLAFNALEAMPEGGLLQVSSEREAAGVVLRFLDTGVGIPEEIAGRLFEPFVSHGKIGGSGLGLAVVKKVVEDHGGEVRVLKPEGGGTCFELRFPSFLDA